jgi:hypothetical protein
MAGVLARARCEMSGPSAMVPSKSPPSPAYRRQRTRPGQMGRRSDTHLLSTSSCRQPLPAGGVHGSFALVTRLAWATVLTKQMTVPLSGAKARDGFTRSLVSSRGCSFPRPGGTALTGGSRAPLRPRAFSGVGGPATMLLGRQAGGRSLEMNPAHNRQLITRPPELLQQRCESKNRTKSLMPYVRKCL